MKGGTQRVQRVRPRTCCQTHQRFCYRTRCTPSWTTPENGDFTSMMLPSDITKCVPTAYDAKARLGKT